MDIDLAVLDMAEDSLVSSRFSPLVVVFWKPIDGHRYPYSPQAHPLLRYGNNCARDDQCERPSLTQDREYPA